MFPERIRLILRIRFQQGPWDVQKARMIFLGVGHCLLSLLLFNSIKDGFL